MVCRAWFWLKVTPLHDVRLRESVMLAAWPGDQACPGAVPASWQMAHLLRDSANWPPERSSGSTLDLARMLQMLSSAAPARWPQRRADPGPGTGPAGGAEQDSRCTSAPGRNRNSASRRPSGWGSAILRYSQPSSVVCWSLSLPWNLGGQCRVRLRAAQSGPSQAEQCAAPAQSTRLCSSRRGQRPLSICQQGSRPEAGGRQAMLPRSAPWRAVWRSARGPHLGASLLGRLLGACRCGLSPADGTGRPEVWWHRLPACGVQLPGVQTLAAAPAAEHGAPRAQHL